MILVLKFTNNEIIKVVVSILKNQVTPIPVRWIRDEVFKETGFLFSSIKIASIISCDGRDYKIVRRPATMREAIAMFGGTTKIWARGTHVYWVDGYGGGDVCSDPRCEDVEVKL